MMHLSQLLKEFYPRNFILDPSIEDITQDSRTVKPNSLFMAYPGLQSDGRRFIDQAISKSTAAILYESADGYVLPAQEKSLPIPMIGIKELYKQVGYIADRFFQHPTQNMPVIGVTGTNGKTSISHFLAQALHKLNYSCAVIGTIGSGFLPHLQTSGYTTPNPILLQKQLYECQKQGARYVTMEVSSHSLDQYRVDGVNFLGGIFTNLTRDHLDYHKTMEAYGAAKARLFQFPHLKFAVYNGDDPFTHQLLAMNPAHVSALQYSMDPHFPQNAATIIAESIKSTRQGFELKIQSPWGKGVLPLSLIGRFNISNVLAVFATLGALGIPFKTILATLAELKSVTGRMQCLGGHGNIPKIIIDYAHTPDALKKALLSIQDHRPQRLWCVFGCGGDRDRGKRPQMGAIAEDYCDKIVLTNDNPRHESPQSIINDILEGIKDKQKFNVELDRAKAIQFAIEHAGPEDIILIAGKGHETQQILGDQILPFNDNEIVEAIINA